MQTKKNEPHATRKKTGIKRQHGGGGGRFGLSQNCRHAHPTPPPCLLHPIPFPPLLCTLMQLKGKIGTGSLSPSPFSSRKYLCKARLPLLAGVYHWLPAHRMFSSLPSFCIPSSVCGFFGPPLFGTILPCPPPPPSPGERPGLCLFDEKNKLPPPRPRPTLFPLSHTHTHTHQVLFFFSLRSRADRKKKGQRAACPPTLFFLFSSFEGAF